MVISDIINGHLHSFMRRRVLNAYNKQINRILKNNPKLAAPIDDEVVKKHLKLYSQLGLPCTDKWLRYYSNLTGFLDYTYIPKDLFYALIERVLNNCDRTNGDIEDKNLLNIYVDKQYLPKTYLRFVRGLYFDENYKFLSKDDVNSILKTDHGPLIGKIASGSLGGHGVKIFKFTGGRYLSEDNIELTGSWIEKIADSYVVQEKLEQCEFANKFNSYSVNTCRITTLRCPWNGAIVVAKAGMRFGVSQAAIDNLSSGGIATGLSEYGELGKFAFDDLCVKKYEIHPTSNICFKGQIHPYYQKMCEVVKLCASKIPNFNLISWDVIADSNGNIKIIELNLGGQGTDVQQFAFGSLFGKYTEPLIKWVSEHKQYDTFHHFRSF